MSVTLAKSAGFCFGVSRAVETVEKQASMGKRVVTLGPIIHNRHVVDKFRSMGVEVVETPEDAPEGSTVIIRSHGVSRDICQRLESRGVEGVMEKIEEMNKELAMTMAFTGAKTLAEIDPTTLWINGRHAF